LQKELISGWEERTASEAVQLGIEIFARSFETDEPRRMIGHALEQMRSRKK
jgi:hypothetical protein